MKKGYTPVLAVDGLTKKFGDKTAVRDLRFEVQKGEIFGFLGPNGAGKTTTIRVVLDVLRATEGSAKLFGQDSREVKATHPRIGFLSGDMVLDGDLTGAQYLNFVDHQYGGGHGGRIKELAKALDISLGSKIDSYSRGNKQKIALIAALAHEPELLILDEPTSGFDPLIQEVFMDMTKKYQARGGTVFMSSHNLGEVQRLCSRAAFIKDGELVGVRDIEDLKRESQKSIVISAKPEVLARIKGGYKTVDGLELAETTKTHLGFTYSGEMTKMLKFVSGFVILDITITEPELEEVFIGYYKKDEFSK